MAYHRLIIIGSGPGGYTAAIYAARANLNPVMITGQKKGGQLTDTTDVDNWPGDVSGLQGPALMDRMEAHAKRFDTQIIYDHVTQANLKTRPFVLDTQSGEQYTCDALIIATGASARYLGVPLEKEYLGRGVSACATCDGFFFKNQDVVVIGGGNTAAEEALYLSKLAKTVTLIHRRDTLRAEKILANQILEKSKTGNIKLIWNHVVTDIIGDQLGVTGLKIQNTQDKTVSELATQGIFVAIGHTPNTQLFKTQLKMDPNGYLITKLKKNAQSHTSIPGVFACGDVMDPFYRQAITSAGSGCIAALDAQKYLEQYSSKKPRKSRKSKS